MSYFKPALQAAPGVKPLDFGCFAGVLDYAKMNFMYRAIMKSKMKKQGVPEGDYRDWPAIRAWAETLVPQLGLNHAAGNELRGT
jgi:menaquinone-dependent protoporphyrinogen oxidase